MEQYSIPLLGPVKSRSRKVVCTHRSYPPLLQQWQDGYLIPSTQSGLDVALNEAVAEQYPYTGDRLHLEMTVPSAALTEMFVNHLPGSLQSKENLAV